MGTERDAPVWATVTLRPQDLRARLGILPLAGPWAPRLEPEKSLFLGAPSMTPTSYLVLSGGSRGEEKRLAASQD